MALTMAVAKGLAGHWSLHGLTPLRFDRDENMYIELDVDDIPPKQRLLPGVLR